jgi:DNA invertase Pin-like site-specific DNA recombinase
MKKAVLYYRFSPRRDKDTSRSIAQQRKLCRAHCKTKDYEIVCEEEDRALSGASYDRPGLERAIQAVKRGYVLVVYSFDRLARSVFISEDICERIRWKRGTVEAVEGGGNGEDPDSVMLRQVLQAIAERRRKVMNNRTSKVMKRHQTGGRRMSKHLPYGFQADPADQKRMIPLEVEQQVIEKIVALCQEGAGECLTTPCSRRGMTTRLLGHDLRLGRFSPRYPTALVAGS